MAFTCHSPLALIALAVVTISTNLLVAIAFEIPYRPENSLISYEDMQYILMMKTG
jgi:hypothetical protein